MTAPVQAVVQWMAQWMGALDTKNKSVCLNPAVEVFAV